jgi:hypothetical protein
MVKPKLHVHVGHAFVAYRALIGSLDVFFVASMVDAVATAHEDNLGP